MGGWKMRPRQAAMERPKGGNAPSRNEITDSAHVTRKGDESMTVAKNEINALLRSSINRRRLLAGAGATGLAVPLLGALPNDALLVRGVAAQAEPTQGGTITWADYEPNTMNPYIASEAIARSAIALVNRGLTGVSPDGAVVPVMAAEIPSEENGGITNDGKTMTWKLKPGLLWSDGE